LTGVFPGASRMDAEGRENEVRPFTDFLQFHIRRDIHRRGDGEDAIVLDFPQRRLE
jgi:hypothetical protein